MYCCHNETCKDIPAERRNLSVLADSGAQRTLISRECVERLNLPVIRTERASLQGYGQKSCSNESYDIVEVLLGKPFDKNPIVMSCMVVKSLNKIYMAGAAQFAKKLARVGMVVADWRFLNAKTDLVVTDILVGADNYRKIV